MCILLCFIDPYLWWTVKPFADNFVFELEIIVSHLERSTVWFYRDFSSACHPHSIVWWLALSFSVSVQLNIHVHACACHKVASGLSTAMLSLLKYWQNRLTVSLHQHQVTHNLYWELLLILVLPKVFSLTCSSKQRRPYCVTQNLLSNTVLKRLFDGWLEKDRKATHPTAPLLFLLSNTARATGLVTWVWNAILVVKPINWKYTSTSDPGLHFQTCLWWCSCPFQNTATVLMWCL